MRGSWRTGARLAGMLVLGTACHRRAPADSDAVERIPPDAARFEISAVTDTTVLFRSLDAHWIRVGQKAYAVDPLQRDAIVARLTLVRVDSAQAMAAITGQLKDVTNRHMVLMVRTKPPLWRDGRFLSGFGAGALLGFIARK